MLLRCVIIGVICFLMTGAQCEETEVFAEAGSQAVLPCHSSSSYPSTIVWSKLNAGTVWRKQKSGLQYWGASWSPKGTQRAQCPHTQFEKGDYSLEINDVTEADGGLYFCRMANAGQVTEKRVMLRIVKVNFSLLAPIWGNEVSISCNVFPWNAGASIQWLLNNSLFLPKTGETSQHVLTQRASASLTGKWTCVVGYKGQEGRASATLNVKGIIQPPKDNTKLYAAVGSAVTLPCVFSPRLIPVKPVWEKMKPGSLFVPVPDRLPASFSASSSPSQSDQSASLSEVGFDDEGTYRCSGIVEGRQLIRKMHLVVAKIESSMSKKRDSVTLTCQLTDTSEVTDYEWVHVVYDVNGTESVGSIQQGKTLMISTASEENQGEWVCRFYGREGVLGNVTHHVQLMSGLSGKKLSGVSNNSAAMIGLSILLIVLLLILVKMILNHRRRKRIFQYPALETIVHTASTEREEREKRERNREKK